MGQSPSTNTNCGKSNVMPCDAVYLNDPAYASVKADLEKRLMDVLSSTGDPRLIDDGKFFESPPMSGPIADDANSRKAKASTQPKVDGDNGKTKAKTP